MKRKYKQTPHSIELGALIKQSRELKDLKQYDIAPKAGMHPMTWSKIERGVYLYEVTRERIGAMCEAMDIHPQSWQYKRMIYFAAEHKKEQFKIEVPINSDEEGKLNGTR